MCEELHLEPALPRRALPWVLCVERLLFGHWELVEDETVRCIYCGTADVSRKSREGRWKRCVDEQGEEQKVAVYRYYCHNPACQYKTFTNLPPNLIPIRNGRSTITWQRCRRASGRTACTAAPARCWG